MKFNPQSFAANTASAKKGVSGKKPPPGSGSSSSKKPSSTLAIAEPATEVGSGKGAAKRKSPSSPAPASSSKKGKSAVASSAVGSGAEVSVPYYLQEVDGKALYVPQWSVQNGSTVFGRPDVGMSMIENIATPRDAQGMSSASTSKVRTDFAHAIALSATLAKHVLERLSLLSDLGETQQGTIRDQEERIRILNEELSSLKGAGEEVDQLTEKVAELEGKLRKADKDYNANLGTLAKKYKAQLADSLKKAVESYKLSNKYKAEMEAARAEAVESFKGSEAFQKELDLYAKEAHAHGYHVCRDVLARGNPSLSAQVLGYEEAWETWQNLGEVPGPSASVPSAGVPDPLPLAAEPISSVPAAPVPDPAPIVVEEGTAGGSGVASEKSPVHPAS